MDTYLSSSKLVRLRLTNLKGERMRFKGGAPLVLLIEKFQVEPSKNPSGGFPQVFWGEIFGGPEHIEPAVAQSRPKGRSFSPRPSPLEEV